MSPARRYPTGIGVTLRATPVPYLERREMNGFTRDAFLKGGASLTALVFLLGTHSTSVRNLGGLTHL